MKKFVVGLCCGIMLFSGFSYASDISSEDIRTILSGMEIIDPSVSENSQITRKELAEILVKASKDADLGKAEIRLSTFSDVPFNYEKASYIRIAALNGYLNAYSDGEFKPDNVVKNEEAVTTMLKLLGYKSSDFTQSYPYEQLTIAKSLGITYGVDVTIGGAVTHASLERLIYNTLNCNVLGSNQKYVASLGYSVSDDITLSDVMSKNVTGPVTYVGDLFGLTGISQPTVYIDGKLSSSDNLAYYDVLYYSENSNTIWAYTDKVTGVLESVSPNKEAPTSVSVSGKNYTLSTYSAKKAFSIDGLQLGNMVTLLLDRNGNVSDVYLTEKLYEKQTGVIVSAGKKKLMTSSGTEKTSYYAEILLTNGERIDVAVNSDYSGKVGYAATLSYKSGKFSISSTKKTTDIYGKFSIENATLGKEKVSENVKILEIDSYGNVISLYPERLNGVYLGKESVVLVGKNDSGVIDTMVIKDVTGDTAVYGILTEINKGRDDDESYYCIVDGNEKNYSNADISFSVEKGPVAIYMDGQSLGEIKNLEKVNGGIVNANSSYVESSKGESFKVSADVVVYYKNNSNYYLYSIDDVMSGEYNVSAYYDTVGELVRVIILS